MLTSLLGLFSPLLRLHCSLCYIAFLPWPVLTDSSELYWCVSKNHRCLLVSNVAGWKWATMQLLYGFGKHAPEQWMNLFSCKTISLGCVIIFFKAHSLHDSWLLMNHDHRPPDDHRPPLTKSPQTCRTVCGTLGVNMLEHKVEINKITHNDFSCPNTNTALFSKDELPHCQKLLKTAGCSQQDCDTHVNKRVHARFPFEFSTVLSLSIITYTITLINTGDNWIKLTEISSTFQPPAVSLCCM